MRNTSLAWLTVALLGIGTPPIAAPNDNPTAIPSISAEAETPALFNDRRGGYADADDIGIWVDRDRGERSLVIGTAKQGGLYAYRLSGELVQHIPTPAAPASARKPSRFNNVDVLQGVALGAGEQDLAIVSDRGLDQVRIYRIAGKSEDGKPLTDLTAPDVPLVFSADQGQVDRQHTAYGLAAWYDRAQGAAYVLVTQRHSTRLALLRLVAEQDKIGYQVVRTLDLPARFTLPDGTTWQPCADPDEGPQAEGMVVDAQTGVLYAGQEDVGIWRMSARLDDTPVLVDKVREFGVSQTYDPESGKCVNPRDPGFGGQHVSADVEGLTLYYGRDGSGYLICSSQGDSTFAVYRREPGNAYVGSFRVAAGKTVDGAEHSDGAAVVGVPLGDKYPKGLLVVHDGDNTPEVVAPNGGKRNNTDFKFVGWEHVAESFPSPLLVDTTTGR
ncbi:phytase [Kutzneria albida]|uniref:3-phytase n=1 Tax=Kutzneria albida DSM 43870 TaxID=1449976 RepID=W5W786_9PSEU|nr:phytase [Kutzneria albida]AHH97023.1 3-phytase [Kutzneria albida DSM 43870]